MHHLSRGQRTKQSTAQAIPRDEHSDHLTGRHNDRASFKVLSEQISRRWEVEHQEIRRRRNSVRCPTLWKQVVQDVEEDGRKPNYPCRHYRGFRMSSSSRALARRSTELRNVSGSSSRSVTTRDRTASARSSGDIISISATETTRLEFAINEAYADLRRKGF